MNTDSKSQPTNRRKGCLVTLAAALFLCMLVYVSPLLRNEYYRSLWHSKLLPSYRIKTSISSMSVLAGTHTLTVSDGVALIDDQRPCPAPCEIMPETWFEYVKGCVMRFPIVFCSVEYDPQYGFPVAIRQNCGLSIMSECSSSLRVDEFTPGQ